MRIVQMSRVKIAAVCLSIFGVVLTSSAQDIYSGWIPGPNAANNYTAYDESSAVCVFPGASIADIKQLRCDMSGCWLWPREGWKGRGFIYDRTDSSFEVEFQLVDDGYVKATMCHFFQKDDGVYAYAKQSGNIGDTSKYGSVIVSGATWCEVSTDTENGAYGVFNIEECSMTINSFDELDESYTLDRNTLYIEVPEGGATFSPAISGNGEVVITPATEPKSVYFEEYVPNDYVVVLENTDLWTVDVAAATMGGCYHDTSDRRLPLEITNLKKTHEVITFQAQRYQDGWLKGLYVELKQSDADVVAKVYWAHYANGSNPIGTDLSGASASYVADSDSAAGYGLSTLTLSVKPKLYMTGDKSWTTTFTPYATRVDGKVAVEISGSALPNGTVTELSDNALVQLKAQAGQFYGDDIHDYEVYSGAILQPNCWLAITPSSIVTLDGGYLHVIQNAQFYLNHLNFKNGGTLQGVAGIEPRVGFNDGAVWSVQTEAVVPMGICLFNNDARTQHITLETPAQMTISGPIWQNYDYPGCSVWKTGSDKLVLKGITYSTGAFRAVEGEIVFGNASAITANNVLEMAGGKASVAEGVDGVTAAALSLVDDSELDATNGGFTFADSSAATWSEGKTLTIKGVTFHRGKSNVRFGTDGNALTAAQLKQIKVVYGGETYDKGIHLDEDGYLYQSNPFIFYLR